MSDTKVYFSAEISELIQFVKNDIRRHSDSKWNELGKEYDQVKLSPGVDEDIYILLIFWESWIDEANHQFPGFYTALEKEDWPNLATEIIEDLFNGRKITNQKVLSLFTNGTKTSSIWGIKTSIATIIAIAFLLFLPRYINFQNLPSVENFKEGKKIREIFPKFDIQSEATFSVNSPPDKIICIACARFGAETDDCDQQFSYVISNFLQNIDKKESPYSRPGMFLSEAIQSKYNRNILRKLYFSVKSAELNEPDFYTLCRNRFKKECNDLTNEALLILKGALDTGKFWDKPIPPFDRLGRCFK